MPKFSEADREARREADRQRTQAAVEALRTTSGWQRWLSSRRHFHQYSLANQLLIALQRPHASRVAGFKAWLKLGYCVKRGESAIRIWMPVPPSKAEVDAWRTAGADPHARPRPRFRLGPVFDRSQVAPLPAPAEPVPLDPPMSLLEGNDLAWAFAPLTSLAGEISSAVVVEPIPNGAGGYFEPATRRIALNRDRSINHQVKTLVHELAHALLRWDLELGELTLAYSEEELVAESIAFTVCGSIGLDTTDYSIPYLVAWSEAADLGTIHRAAAQIDTIAKRIETRVAAAMPHV